MRTVIYVDWNNLYYGVIKNTPFWWLDLQKLFESILQPQHDITCIKIFTAMLPQRSDNEFAVYRQALYHKALALYCPTTKFFFGDYMKKNIQIPSSLAKTKGQVLEFQTYEEKGTDVNLALQMLNDS